jgi:hypothetical protein
VNLEKGTVPFFVGSVPRTDRLGNGPYISQKSEFRKGDSPLFLEVIKKALPIFIGTVPFMQGSFPPGPFFRLVKMFAVI